MREVLVNRLGGQSLPRKSVVRLTDRADMTLDVYRGRKTTMQQQQQCIRCVFLFLVGSLFYRNGTFLLFNIGEGRGRYFVASFFNKTIPDHYFFKE